MGSWSETCALSNLPIGCGDEVYWMILTKSPYTEFSRTGCYHNDFFFVRSIPILGKYDDYGRVVVHDDEKVLVDFMLEQFQHDLLTSEQNEREKILSIPAIEKAAVDLDTLQEWLHEGNIRVDGNYHYRRSFDKKEKARVAGVTLNEVPTPIVKVMVRKDVWEAFRGSFTNYTEIEIAKAKALERRQLWDSSQSAEEAKELWNIMGVIGIATGRLEIYAGGFAGGPPPYGEGPKLVFERLVEYFMAKRITEDEFSKVVTRLCELATVEMTIGQTRRAWFPTTGSGGQNEDFITALDIFQKLSRIAYKEGLEAYEGADRYRFENKLPADLTAEEVEALDKWDADAYNEWLRLRQLGQRRPSDD